MGREGNRARSSGPLDRGDDTNAVRYHVAALGNGNREGSDGAW